MTILRKKLKPGGIIIIEVPHANDFLLSFLDKNEFKRFTLWSQHLILHTRDSLEKLALISGFRNVNIVGHQRYSIANHMHWLHNKAPGGQVKWPELEKAKLHAEYESTLARMGMTDTITCFARV